MADGAPGLLSAGMGDGLRGAHEGVVYCAEAGAWHQVKAADSEYGSTSSAMDPMVAAEADRARFERASPRVGSD